MAKTKKAKKLVLANDQGHRTEFITLAQFARANGKSKSAAIRLYRQGRLKEYVAVEAPVVLLYAKAKWPERAEYGSLTEEQRAAWPQKGGGK